MKTLVYKHSMFGWKAETDIQLAGSRFLRISTHKSPTGRLITTASVNERSKDGMGHTHVMFQDFHARLETGDGRATEAAVSRQQAKWTAMSEDVIQRAAEHYRKLGVDILPPERAGQQLDTSPATA